MNLICNDCSSEFVSNHSTACVVCGSPDVSIAADVSKTEPEQKQKEPSPVNTETLTEEELKDILFQLCISAYDSPFKGIEWEEAINDTIEKLLPYLISAECRERARA